MKNVLFVLLILFSSQSIGQVGINTDTPAPDAALDIEGTDKGILIPRLDLSDLSTIAPVTGGATESLLVYNTNTTTGKGFYFWSGVEWVPVGKGLYWEKDGNTGTTPGTSSGENYLGTKDAQDLVIATNSTEVMRVTSNGQVLASNAGSAAAPTFSFHSDSDTGIYSEGTDKLNVSAAGNNMVEFDGGSNPQTILNPTNLDVDTRIASQGESHMLFVDAGSDRVGIANSNPQATLHVGGTTSTIRIDALNSTNNVNNKGSVSTPVFVDANGELSIQGSNVITQLVEDNTAFLSTPVIVDNTSSGRTITELYATTVTLTRDALIEVVYQAGVTITDTSNAFIYDGRPRIYRIFVEIDGRKVAYKGDAYTSKSATGTTIVNGPFYLNGNGYVQLPGSTTGTTHEIKVFAEVYGNTASTRCSYGGNGDDIFQVLVRY
ncbi:hypothetical protein [Nonlabens ulvanivorans]|uniref:Uncharacterized protein n=1 Tax=Nonlabens ulvanivorans TaxID=906888 RepID=A0A084JXA0_NONUL|nr:hypothetical protein [Nonlabens ulvanivorans]KEZ93584.1 hypothetical protein IL45_05100 [Nonlabens ulvanivorans]PRX14168.1 hypothetical protein LY02_01197 [Nonlabens ulvanivorans]